MSSRKYGMTKGIVTAGLVLGLITAPFYKSSFSSENLQIEQVQAAAISKDMLMIEGKVSGKYTYYYDGKAIRRTKDGKTSKKLTDKITGDFYLSGSKLYYLDSAKGAIYSRNKDGSKPVCLKKYVRQIIEVKSGFIYYINTSGETHRIATDGSKKLKLLGASVSYNTLYTPEYIYYTKYTKGKDGYTNGYQFKRMRRDGTGNTTVLTLPLAENIDHQFSMTASKNYVYVTAGDTIYKIDANGEAQLVYTAEASQRVQLVQATDKTVYIAKEIEEFEPVLQKISASGKVTNVFTPSKYGIYNIESMGIESAGEYKVLTCYGSESRNHYLILDKNYGFVQEIPNTLKKLPYSKCTKWKVSSTEVVVKYEKGKSIIYQTYKIKK